MRTATMSGLGVFAKDGSLRHSGDVEPLLAKPAVPRDLPKTAHDLVSQTTWFGGYDVFSKAPRTSQISRFQIDVYLYLHRTQLPPDQYDLTMHGRLGARLAQC
jgi:hypothetical protein